MNKKTFIVLIGFTLGLLIIGGFVYYLRQKNIESLNPSISVTPKKEEKKKEIVPGIKVIDTPVDTNATKIFYREISSYYSATETKLLEDSAYRDSVLPGNLKTTWTPEYAAQIEKLKASRSTKK